MKSGSIIQFGIALGLFASLLSACDGRGSANMKGYRNSPEEEALYRRKLQADEKLRQQAMLQGRLDPEDSPLLDPAPSSSSPSATPGGSASVPMPKDDKNPGDHAQGKQIDETRGDGQARIGSRLKVDAAFDTEIEAGTNPQAVERVKEVAVEINGQNPPTLNLVARITLDGAERFLKVEQGAVIFDYSGEVSPLDVSMYVDRSMQGQKFAVGNNVYVFAYCASYDCKEIRVLLDLIAPKNNRVWTALKLKSRGGKYVLVQHNLAPDFKLGVKQEQPAEDGASSVPKEPGDGKPGTAPGAPSAPQTGSDSKGDKLPGGKKPALGGGVVPVNPSQPANDNASGKDTKPAKGQDSTGTQDGKNPPAAQGGQQGDGKPAADQPANSQPMSGEPGPLPPLQGEPIQTNPTPGQSGDERTDTPVIDLLSQGIAPSTSNIFAINSAATKRTSLQPPKPLNLQPPSPANTASIMFQGKNSVPPAVSATQQAAPSMAVAATAVPSAKPAAVAAPPASGARQTTVNSASPVVKAISNAAAPAAPPTVKPDAKAKAPVGVAKPAAQSVNRVQTTSRAVTAKSVKRKRATGR